MPLLLRLLQLAERVIYLRLTDGRERSFHSAAQQLLRQIAYTLFPLEKSGERNATPFMAATYFLTFCFIRRLRFYPTSE